MGYPLPCWLSQGLGGGKGHGVLLWACKVSSQEEQLDVGTAGSVATPERDGHCQFLP